MASPDPTDTGHRVTFATGAKRERVLDARYDLLPPCVLERLALRYALGAKKYGDRNYLKGLPLTDVFNHAVEHLYKWFDGYRRGALMDEDHIAAALWNVATLLELTNDVFPELEERPHAY